jgi:hypothetical protein
MSARKRRFQIVVERRPFMDGWTAYVKLDGTSVVRTVASTKRLARFWAIAWIDELSEYMNGGGR